MLRRFYKNTIKAFGNFGTRYIPSYVGPLKEEIMKSNLNILIELYVGKMLFLSFASFIFVFTFITILFLFLGFPAMLGVISALILGSISSLIILVFYHSYPFQLITSKKNDIESNMPFAVNHMAAIASAGVPPLVVFKLMTRVHEYGEMMNESRRIVRNVEVFGMDLNTAIKNVASRTPSDTFRQFLFGIVSTIETGGDLRKYFGNSAKEALFDYRLKREKYMQTLSTYADFYTAVLIAAPLFFISILSVMALIGGSVFGLTIPDAMRLGIYVMLPLLNIMFIAFIHYTQPKA